MDTLGPRAWQNAGMTYLDTLRSLLAEKESEIVRLEAELDAAHSYQRFLAGRIDDAEQRRGEEPASDDPVLIIRRLVLEAGKPLFIDDILRGLRLPLNRDSREEIQRMLVSWVRRGEIFTGPRPSTFGLIEMEGGASHSSQVLDLRAARRRSRGLRTS